MRILLLSGGRSAEREVSLVSGEFVGKVLSGSGHSVISMELDSSGTWLRGGSPVHIDTSVFPWAASAGSSPIYFDLVFPVLHGPWGEDGTVQGLCSLAGWPCAGAGVMTSSVAMNKAVTKRLVSAAGIPVLPWMEFVSSAPPTAEELAPLGYPLFVKPSRMGSSVGISRVGAADELGDALLEAFRYDPLIVVEKGLQRPREIEVSVLGERSGVSSSVAGEVIPGMDWYSYDAKYDCDDSRLRIPADLDDHEASSVRSLAGRAFSLLGGRGFARVDFLMDIDGTIYFNEINTIPGFTGISMFAKLWEASGIPPGELLERILDEAMARHSRRSGG